MWTRATVADASMRNQQALVAPRDFGKPSPGAAARLSTRSLTSFASEAGRPGMKYLQTLRLSILLPALPEPREPDVVTAEVVLAAGSQVQSQAPVHRAVARAESIVAGSAFEITTASSEGMSCPSTNHVG